MKEDIVYKEKVMQAKVVLVFLFALNENNKILTEMTG